MAAINKRNSIDVIIMDRTINQLALPFDVVEDDLALIQSAQDRVVICVELNGEHASLTVGGLEIKLFVQLILSSCVNKLNIVAPAAVNHEPLVMGIVNVDDGPSDVTGFDRLEWPAE